MKTISERINHFRRCMHLPISYLANYLSISDERLEGIENGTIEPTDIEISALAHIFRISVHYIKYGNVPLSFIKERASLTEHDYHEILSLLNFKQMVKGDSDDREDYCIQDK